VDRYLEMLSSGGSIYPLDLLKKAGVDLTTKEPIESAMKKFSQLLDEFSSCLK
jgi:oligoendopeptidase F